MEIFQDAINILFVTIMITWLALLQKRATKNKYELETLDYKLKAVGICLDKDIEFLKGKIYQLEILKYELRAKGICVNKDTELL